MASAVCHIGRDKPVTAAEIEDLRCSVGWDRFEDKYDQILPNSYTHFTVYDANRLIGFLNVISDGIGDAFLLDLMVAPDFQKRGIGKALVKKAVTDLTMDGIRCIHATFSPDLEGFYTKCGFPIFSAGIIDTVQRDTCANGTRSDTVSTPAI